MSDNPNKPDEAKMLAEFIRARKTLIMAAEALKSSHEILQLVLPALDKAHMLNAGLTREAVAAINTEVAIIRARAAMQGPVDESKPNPHTVYN